MAVPQKRTELGLVEFGVFAVVVGELLEGAASLENGRVVAGAAQELQAHGKFFVGEAARDRDCG